MSTHTPPRRSLIVTYWVLSALCFLALALIGWHLSPNGIWGLYTLSDGALAAWNSESIFQWSAPFDPSPYNFLQGLGSLYIPNTPWTNPGALVMSLPTDVPTRYYLSYSIYFLELFVSAVALGRALRLPWVQCITAAQLLCLVTFPPFSGYFLTLPWFSLAPFNAHLMALFNLSLVIFTGLGTGSNRKDILRLASFAACVVAIFYTAEITAVTYVPVYALFGFALFWNDCRRRSMLWKIGTLVGLGVILAVMHASDFYVATAQVTSSHLTTALEARSGGPNIWSRLLQGFKSYDWCGDPQVFLCSNYRIAYFHAAGLAGAALLALLRRGTMRWLGMSLLVYALFFHLYAVGAELALLSVFNRINKVYLVFASYTFYAISAIAGVFALLDFLTRAPFKAVGDVWPRTVRPARIVKGFAALVASLVLPVYAGYILFELQGPTLQKAIATRQLPPTQIHEPEPNPITALLSHEAGLRPGAQYQGLTTSYFAGRGGPLRRKLGVADRSPSNPSLYIDSRHYLEAQYGNRFMMTDLWRWNIPTFEEYGQWITKPLYAFNRAMLGRAEDVLSSWETQINDLRIPLMQAIGIRFLITDSELVDDRLTLRRIYTRTTPSRPEVIHLAARGAALLAGPPVPVRLYEIDDPNLASYSPVEVIVRSTAIDAFKAMRDPAFSARRQVVLGEDPGVTTLVPVASSKLEINRGSIRVSARTSGTSLLLLPIQFSHCLSAKPHVRGNDVATARLLRANIVQSALLFEGSVDIDLSFDFAPGRHGATCRFSDAHDYERLDFSPWRQMKAVSPE